MTKQEIEQAIKNGESVWVVYNSYLPYKLVMEENLTKEYSIEPYYLKEQKWALWLENRYICDIDRVYKTKAEAEHYLHHANVIRTETLPFLTWKEFLEERHLSFIGKNEIEYMLCIFGDKIDLAEHRACSSFVIKEWHATEANFYKAYDECVRLFRGE